MSSAVMGTPPGSKEVAFGPDAERPANDGEEGGESSQPLGDADSDKDKEKLSRKFSYASVASTDTNFDDDDDDRTLDDEDDKDTMLLGPQVTLKEQLELDKDDESLRRWKEQLLGNVDLAAVGVEQAKLQWCIHVTVGLTGGGRGLKKVDYFVVDLCTESAEPEVQILSLAILSPEHPEIILPFPLVPNAKGYVFAFKDGSRYHLKFTFTVFNNIVSGLKYTNTVWKMGVRVENTKVMLGTFSPRQEPYTYELEEETTPSGMFARGSYSARTKFMDDDGKCYLDVNYHFEIRKDWGTSS